MLRGTLYGHRVQEDPLLRVLGEIEEDGTFVLRSIKENLRVLGAPAGEYNVIIQLPLEEVMISGPQSQAQRRSSHSAHAKPHRIEPKENGASGSEIPTSARVGLVIASNG